MPNKIPNRATRKAMRDADQGKVERFDTVDELLADIQPRRSARTSDRVSSIAAKYLRHEPPIGLTAKELNEEGLSDTSRFVSRDYALEILADAKTMAASLLRQDEHRGFRGAITRLLSRKAK